MPAQLIMSRKMAIINLTYSVRILMEFYYQRRNWHYSEADYLKLCIIYLIKDRLRLRN